MIKKTIINLLIVGTVFSTVAIKANADVTNVSGWKENSDKTWSYTDSQGTYSNKWLKENEEWYFFKEDGRMAKGWITVNNSKYFLNESGKMAYGWLCIDGPWFFFDRETGAFVE